MAENSKIGWTHHTMNFWWGCNKVSQECRCCYIGQIMRRAGREPFQGPMRTKDWSPPHKWNREAAKQRKRLRVFTCSMSDFFHAGADEWRDEAWHIIRECRQLDWLILTKRPEFIRERLPADWGTGYANVWLGVTCGVESSMWPVEEILQIPAHLRFISAEPLLGPLDLRAYLGRGIDWVITGCENAHQNKRVAMDLDWVRDIEQQCREAGIPHFFKQYYAGNQLQFDGKLDGRCRQAFPRRPARRPAAH
jgi:protein gp37